MTQALLWAAGGTGFTALMTASGAAMVFLFRKQSSRSLQRVLLGFAAGVMIAASMWSLLIPAIEEAEAMGMPGIRKRLSESAGSVSREFIYLYPPGIPVLAPGEEITEDVLERAAWYEAMGLSVQGLEDPSLSTIITVAEK